MNEVLVPTLLMGAGVALILVALRYPATREAAASRSLARRFEDVLVRAGIERVPPVAFMVAIALIAIVCAAAALATTGIAVLALLAGVFGGWIPVAIIQWRARQRRRAHRGVWPDAIDHLIAAVRSGLGLGESIAQLAKVGPELLRDDFAYFSRSYRATGSFDHAVNEIKDRLADPTADRIFETLRMARRVGGTELVVVLRSLGTFLREEQAVRHEAEARQGWVMNAARLAVVAPWLVLVMLASRPEAAAAYNTPAGAVVILSGLTVTVLTYRLMTRIGRFREEGRWFA
ncbi:type II secretion system F family protein [Gulosibacter hominis]|uniref:type II secretion system F family protein n=1 Tax=Gulosibacter hominis TaxID=2770504 RepID=UPI001918991A|nr:type II secretion system F family protein [Gulosibacter hominis]